MFERWRKMPIPLTFKIYVFDVVNAEGINNGEKPQLEEKGPYVYKEYREKTILGYGENDTIEYMLKKTFVFDQKESGQLTEDDEVTVINFTYMAAILQVQDMMPGLVGVINTALGDLFTNLTDPFLRVKVKDLFFDGIYLNCVSENSALGVRRLQFNIELRQIPAAPQLARVPTGLFPLLWIDEGAEIPPEIQEELIQSHKLLGYVELSRWVLLALAIIATLIGAYFVARSGALPMCARHTNSVRTVRASVTFSPGSEGESTAEKERSIIATLTRLLLLHHRQPPAQLDPTQPYSQHR
ncbi:hypothetical protein MSG28_001375 [Choristoneura fumiferana]|uniref:Uncharacterized protein n=1 Tax=Choristoneura fumiferana TaxID=7141 RepID=A0ACC0KTI7_CHOFU|nr:hypothetical protein MSG28_001375 [Choristoneura fumiferana]